MRTFTFGAADYPVVAIFAKSFRKPTAIVVDGQIVAIDDLQLTSPTYQPIDGVLVSCGQNVQAEQTTTMLDTRIVDY